MMKLQAGDRVMIRTGPFKGLTGTVTIVLQGALAPYLVSHDKSMPGMHYGHGSGHSLPECNGWWYEENWLQPLTSIQIRAEATLDALL